MPVPQRLAKPFGASDGLSFGDRLSRLEQSNFMGQAPADASILDRIARVEQRLFGQVRPGSIVERLKALERAPMGPSAATPPLSPNQQLPPIPQMSTIPQTLPSAQAAPSTPMSSPAQGAPQGIPGAMAAIIKSAHVASVVALPDIYPPRFFHVPAATETKADTTDYLSNVLTESKNKILKFEKMPIPIYITPIQEFGFSKAIREAFDDWDQRTNGLVKFVEVKNQKDARIIVIFSKMGLKAGTDCSLGAHTMTKWKSRGGGRLAFLPVGAIPVPLYIPSMGPKYSVPPQVIEVNLDVIYSHEDEVRLLLLKNIATHELGHALGMLGHSANKTDMMYPITDEHSRISQRDINTVTRLYEHKADIPL